jgi:hypothetical protein
MDPTAQNCVGKEADSSKLDNQFFSRPFKKFAAHHAAVVILESVSILSCARDDNNGLPTNPTRERGGIRRRAEFNCASAAAKGRRASLARRVSVARVQLMRKPL